LVGVIAALKSDAPPKSEVFQQAVNPFNLFPLDTTTRLRAGGAATLRVNLKYSG
jgi:hypothetical protein